LVYNNRTGSLGNFPMGFFEINKDPNKQWWIKGVGGNPDRKWPKDDIPSPTDKWWIDAGTHNFVRKDAQGDIMGSGFTVVIWEGNTQFTDGDPKPLAMTNLVASVISSTQVNLNWIDLNSPAATPYKVFRDNVEIAEVSNTSYSDLGVSPGTSYGYTISGNGTPESDPAFATTPASYIQVTDPDGGQYKIGSDL
jgi:hypothetical protein